MRHLTTLNQDHVLGNARTVKKADLVMHLKIDHGVSADDRMTKAELGKIHLLAHTVHAFPEIRELMGLDMFWGN